MRILALADLHCQSHTSYQEVDENGYNLRLQDSLKVFTNICEYALKHKILYVFVLGDSLHVRERIHVSVFNSFYNLVKRYSDKINFVFLVGQHEKSLEHKNSHVLEAFKEIAKVIDSPKKFKIEDTTFCCIPHQDNKENLTKYLSKIREHHVLLMHQSLSDVRLPSGGYNKSALLSTRGLPECRLTLLGDYHHYRRVADNVYYVGSALQHDSGDRGKQSYFFDITFKENTFKLSKMVIDAPRFLKVTFKEAKFYLGDGVKNYFIVKIKGSQVSKFSKLKEQLLKQGARHVEPELLSQDEIVETSELGDSLSLGDSFLEFLKESPRDMSGKKLSKVGNQIVQLNSQ